MTGSWNVNISVGSMPEKVATAVSALSTQLVGAEYEPIAYLGSQVVNGTNHAVLAEQTVLAGKDTKNIVVLIFNEKGMECTLVNIERILESGGEAGGVVVDAKTKIPVEAKEAFETSLEGYVGAKIEPFALLGTQVTKGVNYIFAAEATSVTLDASKAACMVVVNDLTKDIAFTDLLTSKHDVLSLGYAFTWLKRGTSFGGPLGEWP